MIALNSIFNILDSEKICIIPVDTPCLKFDTITSLIYQSKQYDITIARDNNKTHTLCGVFSSSLKQQINKYVLKDIHKINFLLKNTINKNIIFIDDDNEFLNVNTKTDYKNAIDISNNYI
jgi:molybdopterin-guanine dinucleotide biosynthesis protein A